MRTIKPNFSINDVAKVCHEVNREYCLSLGDTSQPSWDTAPDWQRDSAVNGVVFHLENPTAGPSASHDSWMKEKLQDGWVYGPIKDPSKKQHPCMVPYDKLPKHQQTKDHLFIAVIKSCCE